MSSFSVDFNQGAEEQYLQLLRNILEYGNDKGDRTGTGTRDLFGYQLRIDLNRGFPLLTTKKMFHRGMVEELLWMTRGETHVRSLQEKNVRIWDEWSTPEQCARFGRPPGELGPIYGHVWRNFGGTLGGSDGVDQLSLALNALRKSPFSRRILVTGWDPREVDNVALPPCHTIFQFSTREEERAGLPTRFLDCQLYQRSADVFLGVPFNIASYALLTHIVAGLAGMTPGTFVHTFGSVHIYRNHFEQVREQLSREPLTLPRLRIKTFDRHHVPSSPALPNPVSAADVYAVPHDGVSSISTSTDPRNWSIDDFLSACKGAEDFEFVGYQSHSAIKADVSV